VGQKNPNAFGLYDMHGNVYEWCQDWFANYLGDAMDPQGFGSGSLRVSRGGSWPGPARYCRTAFRRGNTPSDRYSILGFRVASVVGLTHSSPQTGADPRPLRHDSLVGTRWFIEDTSETDTHNKTIEFLENGNVRLFNDPGDRSPDDTPDNDMWEPTTHDGVIRFHFNNKYVTYEGRRIDNRTIVGESRNVKGQSWTWRATLVESANE
jgi:hypothetical protein